MKNTKGKKNVSGKIFYLPINKIQPDPENPRTTFSTEGAIKLALSLKEMDLINPIEVDEKNMIVTGERRWRAAKDGGFKQIKCVRVLGLTPIERLKRQLDENNEREAMNPMDQAVAWNRLLLLRTAAVGKKIIRSNDEGITDLATYLHIPWSTVSDCLKLLELSKAMQRAVRSGKVAPSLALEIKFAPEDDQKVLEEKILAGNFKTRSSVRVHIGYLKNNASQIEAAMELGITMEPMSLTEQETIGMIKALALRLEDSASDNTKAGQAAITRELAELEGIIKWREKGLNKIVDVVAIKSQKVLDF